MPESFSSSAPLTPKEIQEVQRILSDPTAFPYDFKTWLVAYVSLRITISQSQVVTSAVDILRGTGSPEGAVAGAVGSVYLRTDGGAGTTIYFKESGGGTSGWVRRDTFTDGLSITDGKDITIGNSTGTKIGQAASKIALWGETPVNQHATTGQTAGFTAGAGAASLVDSTYTGGVGTKAYTVGDIVKALKNAGVMAKS
jgi:hypothetical protein